jgi:hypothetical protein
MECVARLKAETRRMYLPSNSSSVCFEDIGMILNSMVFLNTIEISIKRISFGAGSLVTKILQTCRSLNGGDKVILMRSVQFLDWC